MNEKIKKLIEKELENFYVQEKEINEVKKEIIKFLEDNFSDYITVIKSSSTLYDDTKKVYFYFNSSGNNDVIYPYIIKLNNTYYYSNGFHMDQNVHYETLDDMIPFLAHIIAYHIKKEKSNKEIVIKDNKEPEKISIWKFWKRI